MTNNLLKCNFAKVYFCEFITQPSPKKEKGAAEEGRGEKFLSSAAARLDPRENRTKGGGLGEEIVDSKICQFSNLHLRNSGTMQHMAKDGQIWATYC